MARSSRLQTTIAVRVDSDLIGLIDTIIEARTKHAMKYERAPSRSDIVRELLSLGARAGYGPPDDLAPYEPPCESTDH